jgi:hypothetical protein
LWQGRDITHCVLILHLFSKGLTASAN